MWHAKLLHVFKHVIILPLPQYQKFLSWWGIYHNTQPYLQKFLSTLRLAGFAGANMYTLSNMPLFIPDHWFAKSSWTVLFSQPGNMHLQTYSMSSPAIFEWKERLFIENDTDKLSPIPRDNTSDLYVQWLHMTVAIYSADSTINLSHAPVNHQGSSSYSTKVMIIISWQFYSTCVKTKFTKWC